MNLQFDRISTVGTMRRIRERSRESSKAEFSMSSNTKRNLFIIMAQPESVSEDHTGSSTSTDDDEDVEFSAVNAENVVKIAKMCLEKSKRAEMRYVDRIVHKGLNLRGYDMIDKYQQEVSKAAKAVEEDMMCNPSSTKTYVTDNLVRSQDARLGLCQMADVCLSIVNLFCLCKIDIFSGARVDGGISRCIWQLMGR
jgi:hypothetical protein